MPRFRPARSKSRLCPSGQSLLTALSLLIVVFASSTHAEAQFNARGRGRAPTTTNPKPASPRSNTSPQKPSNAPAGVPQQGISEATASSTEARNNALIVRYRALIIEQPGEELPIARLAELTRTRDGSLEKLLSELEQELKTTSNKYAVLVALGGLFAEDKQLEKAAESLKRATENSPNRKEAWLALARLKKQTDENSASLAALEKALPLTNGPERTLVLRSLRDLCLDLAEYDAAAKYHASLVKEASGNIFLQGELGRELLARGQIERAVAELNRVVKASSGDSRALAPALRDLGAAQFEAEQLVDAIKTLERASQLSVNEPGQRVAIDTLLAEAHRKNGSLNSFIEQLEKDARSQVRLALLARLLEEEGQTEKAISAYQTALSRDPSNLDIRLTLVRLLELTGDIDGAVREYEKLVKSSPRDIQLSLRYMEMLLAQGERKLVLNEWDRVERLTQSDPEAGLLLIDVAERLEEVERAERLLARLSNERGGDSRFLVELGARFYRKGDEKNARRAWDKILLVEREPAQGYIVLGEVLLDHEAIKDGLDALEKAVALAPRDIRARRALALGLERAASQAPEATRLKYERAALDHFLVLLALPDSPGASSARTLAERHVIRLWRRSGALTLELNKLKKKLHATPPDLQAGRLLASGLLAERRWSDAISTLQKILAVNKGDHQALTLLEAAYEKSGQGKLAIETLKRLVEVDPSRAREYYERMAKSASQAGDADAALRYAELAVAKNPSDPHAQAQLGELYLMQGKVERAKSAFRSALKLDDRLHTVALKLAELLGQSGQLNQALELLTHVVRTSNDHDIVARAARRALSMSIPVDKVREFEDVLRPLAIGRSEQPLYRALLLEVLAAEMSPLIQRAKHGTGEDRTKAELALTSLADRSTQPLLAALSSSFGQEQQTAITLLAYSSVNGVAGALLAFAEGGAKEEQRLLAVLAAGRQPRPGVAERLAKLLLQDGSVSRGRLAQSAVWSLGRQADPQSIPLLLRCLGEGEPDIRVYAALSLASIAKTRVASKSEITTAFLSVLEDPTKGELTRSAVALSLSHFATPSRTAPNKTTLDKQETRLLEALQMLAETGSTLLVQASLLSLSSFTPSPEIKQALARGLNSEFEKVRGVASLAATRALSSSGSSPKNSAAESLLPSTLNVSELSAELQLKRLLMNDAEQEIDPQSRHQALLALQKEYAEEARFSLQAQPSSARGVLERLSLSNTGLALPPLLLESDQSPLLAQTQAAVRGIHEELTPDLIALATGANPELAELAIRTLRIESGEKVEGLMREALRGPLALAALSALSRSPSVASVALLEDTLQGSSDWTLRRRVAMTLGDMKQHTTNTNLKKRIDDQLKKLENDPHEIVRTEAAQQRSPESLEN